MLLLVGKQDTKVWPRNTYHFADKIKAAGGAVEVAEFANYGHIDMVAKLAKPLRGDDELLNTVIVFLQKH
jgi:Prolyl oligopeptidase family